MSSQFRELLKKVGSGQHTKENLTRMECEEATRMMLLQEATPAQIGAFMIAHRIKRITPEELAGMLDAYDSIGPKISGLDQITVFGIPYDGRIRTAPIAPITALILATVGIPVLLHGGESMPTKYGIPLIDLWQSLGLDLRQLSLDQVEKLLVKTNFGLIYLPQHFPEANGLVTYRDQLGKRPPLATLELAWLPCKQPGHLIAGYVHPPTESLFRETFKLRNFQHFTLVKGLEGSCDLPRARTAIIVIDDPSIQEGYRYLKLHAEDYGLGGEDVSLESHSLLFSQLEDVLAGKACEFLKTAIWNGGFYLWRCGICSDLATGLTEAESLLVSGKVREKLEEIKGYL
jgi:anthranilate phosphoribosyltransferase